MKKNYFKIFIITLILILLPVGVLFFAARNTCDNETEDMDFQMSDINGESINIIRIPYANNLTVFNENYNFIHHLSKLINKEVKLLVSKDYADFSQMIKDGAPDIVWGATNDYLKNRTLFDSYEVVLRPVIDGQDRYRGIIIVRDDSDIKSVKDLKNKVFAFTDVNSGSGYKLPVKLFKEKYNIDLYSFFQDIKYLGSHQAVIDSVFYGKVDAGSVFESAPEVFLKENKDKVRIIEKTDYILNEPILVKKSKRNIINDTIIEKIINNTPESVVKDLSIDGFAKASAQDYK